LEADGISSFALRVANLHASIPIQAGLDNATVNEVNHYGEIQLLKLNGAVTLPASEWAVRELLMNTALEVGTVGQAIGYTAAGEVGVVSLGSGGGGADYNAVASVLDLATLTNTVTGYSKAIVGGPADAGHKLFQRVQLAEQIPATAWTGLDSATVVVNGDGSGTVSGNQPYLQVTFLTEPAYNGQSCKLSYYAKANEVSAFGNSSMWTTPVWATPVSVGLDWAYYEVTFTATSSTASTSYRDTDSTADSTTYQHVYFAYGAGPFGEFPNGTTILASAIDSGYGWKLVGDIYPDALSDGQTYGRKDGAWAVVTGGALTTKTIEIPSVNYQFVPDTDVIVVNSTLPFTSGDYFLTGQPTILPGVDGQHLTITNISNADLQFTVGSAFGIYARSSPFTIASDIKFDQNYVGYFRFNGPTGQWDAIGGWPVIQALEATLLPAPWGPPDADGNQVIRDDVQDALIDALLPRLLQRLEPAAGTLPAPAPSPAPRRLGKPGTLGNPIDWPAAPEPAAAAGKYNVTIKIGDQ
jgi:hypothetical protein